MKNIKLIISTVALTLVLLPSYSQEKTDSVYEFRFVSGKDQFYSLFKNNKTELSRLMKCIELNKEGVKQEKIQVNGYCTSQSTTQARLDMAKVRSNRVKSYMITHAGLTEDCFVTNNHADDGDYVTVRLNTPTAVAVAEEETQNPETKEESIVEQTVVAPPKEEVTQASTIQTEETPNQTEETPNRTAEKPTSQHISLRANLLRWATLTPDLGIEWQFARQWGVAVNGSWTSWSWNNKNRRYALWEVSPEVRYYFTPKNKFYVGAQYKIGQFNYKLSNTGKQGDLQGGGITLGYKLPLCKSLALDFNAAVGCLHTNYKTYHVTDRVRVKDVGHTKNVWGVTDLGITLVWTLK